jgi:flagellar biosynthesis protein FlhF
MTKLDEATSLGAMLSLLIEHDMPAAYYTDGQRVPEDIHIARANTLVHLAFEAMKRSGRTMADEWFEAAFGGTAVNGNG